MEAILNQGEEGRKVRFLLLELRDVIQLASRGVPRLRQRIQGLDAAALASLDEFLTRLNQVSEKLEPILALVDRQPAVDPTRFTLSQEEMEYVSLTNASSLPSLNGGR